MRELLDKNPLLTVCLFLAHLGALCLWFASVFWGAEAMTVYGPFLLSSLLLPVATFIIMMWQLERPFRKRLLPSFVTTLVSTLVIGVGAALSFILMVMHGMGHQ